MPNVRGDLCYWVVLSFSQPGQSKKPHPHIYKVTTNPFYNQCAITPIISLSNIKLRVRA